MNKKEIKEAAAIKYDENDIAPKIVALGKGQIAEKIIEKAKQNNVPIEENKELSHILNTLSIGDQIPPELYEVVAEILVFVHSLDK
jgi:flagellar biosynthesis protein